MKTSLAFSHSSQILTNDTEDIKGLRLFDLPIQLPTAPVGPVLKGGPVPLAGDVDPLQGHVTVPLVEGDIDFGVGDHTGDNALITGLSHHAMGGLDEPHLRVCVRGGERGGDLFHNERIKEERCVFLCIYYFYL